MEQKTAVSLLQATTLLQSVVLSCIDRKNSPLTKTQLTVFTVLDMEGELTMKRVAQYIASSQEQATRAVAPLVDAGYVERRTDPANRTRVYIHLTDSGRQLLEAKRTQLAEKLSAKLDTSLSSEETAALYRAVTDMVEILEKL